MNKDHETAIKVREYIIKTYKSRIKHENSKY